jgi:steroid 5-alpha reductase family enzyme
MTGLTGFLLINLTLLLAIILVLWRISIRLRDVSFIDSFWAFGMVLLAWCSWLQVGASSATGTLLLALGTIWGLRLSIHLFTRWRAEGEDKRYKMIMGYAMEKQGWSWSKVALIKVFLMQAPLLFITCLPAQLGIWASDYQEGGLSVFAWIGAIIAAIGIGFETIGDAQLKAFAADPANKGKVLDTGLWRYTRHPNYFGDFATWWGIWLVATSISLWVGIASIIGPIFLSFTLMRWSGAPMLERGLKKSRPGYDDYVARTSEFFPWPPKE